MKNFICRSVFSIAQNNFFRLAKYAFNLVFSKLETVNIFQNYESTVIDLYDWMRLKSVIFEKNINVTLVLKNGEFEFFKKKYELEILNRKNIHCIHFIDNSNNFNISGEESYLLETVYYVKNARQAKQIAIAASKNKIKIYLNKNLNFAELELIKSIFYEHNIDFIASQYLEHVYIKNTDFWYNPQFDLIENFKSDTTSINASLIIPFQDNLDEFQICLNCLYKSFTEATKIELLIVDDSCKINNFATLKPILKKRSIDYKYIKLHRQNKRRAGDRTFRAGIARNIGALHAESTNLIFMDSDMIIGSNFWKIYDNLDKSGKYLFMPQRIYLNQTNPTPSTYNDIKIGEDTTLSPGGYWEDFYNQFDINNENWRWVSTYCLCVSRDVFTKIGGFRRNYYSYGFEDTEFGLSAYELGYNLNLLDVHVYHLPLKKERSEYKKDLKIRKNIFLSSFKVFYINYFHKDLSKIFQNVVN